MEIDVSKCTYYNGFCYETNQLCKDVDDKYCAYKQLQQLKESNKTLNEMLLILNNRLEEYKRIYGEL